MVYYKSYRIVDGKPRWVIEDEDGNINKSPTKEQLNTAFLDNGRKKILDRRCCICGSNDTYIYPDGRVQWHGHTCKKEGCTYFECDKCYRLNLHVDRSETDEYLRYKRKGRKCYKCGIDLSGEKDYGHMYYDKKGYLIGFICYDCRKTDKSDTREYLLLKRKDRRCCRCKKTETYTYLDGREAWISCSCDGISCTGWLCNRCWQKLQQLWRNGLLDRYSSDGKAIISQWIVAKNINLFDLNVINDNFREKIDLSYHPMYKRIDVKSATLFGTVWLFSGIVKNCDTFFFVCMDRLWKNVERIYIIPKSELYGDTYVEIYKYTKEWYEEFRIDEIPYNDTYHSIDIPEFFSPVDLWNGKYNSVRREKI